MKYRFKGHDSSRGEMKGRCSDPTPDLGDTFVKLMVAGLRVGVVGDDQTLSS